MSHRQLLAFVLIAAAIVGCASEPQRKCTSRYFPVREYLFCDMGPNRAKELFDRGGLW